MLLFIVTKKENGDGWKWFVNSIYSVLSISIIALSMTIDFNIKQVMVRLCRCTVQWLFSVSEDELLNSSVLERCNRESWNDNLEKV